jgi:hypothetical protein
MLTLFTNRFQNFQPGQGTPVRITRGAPRWKLADPLDHPVRELAPWGPYFGKALPEFTSGFRADLDKVGAPRIAELLQAITEQARDHRLVLLCFEDLSKPGEWCHRRIFADWWKDTTGDDVRELGPLPQQWQDTLI